MRTIKFRTPYKCQNKHFRWGYSTILEDGSIKFLWGERSCNCPIGEFNEGYSPCGEHQLLIGLLDKNEKEIYEGDIVKDKLGASYKIFWDDAGLYYLPGFAREGLEKNTKTIGFTGEIEVIGNIYENPSLLTSQNNV
jgi:hypothetical protein